MHRFHIPPAQLASADCHLSTAEAHHAISVLRITSGETVEILDGQGGSARARVVQVGKRDVHLHIVERLTHQEPLFRLTLRAALLKTRSMDWLLQKAVELGVHSIQPVQAQRSVSVIDKGSFPSKRDGWNQTIIEAARQCGAARFPTIDAPESVAALCARSAGGDPRATGLSLVASLESRRQSVWSALEDFESKHQRPPVEVVLWVGPEGDFSPSEYAAISASGAVPVDLGPLVLRAETASLAGVAILGSELRRRWSETSRTPCETGTP